MDWSKGYTSSCYMTMVNARSWRDAERAEIISGSVSRTEGNLMEAATVECADYAQETERWIRIWMDVRQNGLSDHVPIFTGLATSPGKSIDGRIFRQSLECYSVLQPAADIRLPRGWFAPEGVAGAELVRQLLAVTPAPKEIADGSPALLADYIAEDGETNLSMAWKLLNAINWRMRITGSGIIQILPKASEASAAFDALDNDVIEPKLSTSFNWFSCPNVLRVTSGDLTAVARDENPDSILSVEARGREVWAEESSVSLAENENVATYAARRLKEMQNVIFSASYDRRFNPDVTIGDLVRMHYPKQGLQGLYRVTRQSIELKTGGRTSEVCERHEI